MSHTLGKAAYFMSRVLIAISALCLIAAVVSSVTVAGASNILCFGTKCTAQFQQGLGWSCQGSKCPKFLFWCGCGALKFVLGANGQVVGAECPCK